MKASLPLVVQLGFAGSRHLVNPLDLPSTEEKEFLSAVQAFLTLRIKKLSDDLGLGPHHFLCGISQIAIGADMLFTRACRDLHIPQRIYLPGHREEYLNAVGSDGTPDFPGVEQEMARTLLASSHVIEERVVSDSAERHAGFEDANLQIVQDSDVLVCLIRASSEPGSGGTYDLVARAASRNKPVLVITVSARNGEPDCQESWLWNQTASTPPEQLGRFTPPTLPPALTAVMWPRKESPDILPEATDYFGALKTFSSSQARSRRNFFRSTALIIIGAHVLATICAALVMKAPGDGILPWFLGGELLLLAGGFGVHQYLRHSAAAYVWAVSRLIAELNRSVLAVGKLHIYLEHLFSQPFPEPLRPLLRTLNVLHLRSTRVGHGQSWEYLRDAYVEKRLTGTNGQLEYCQRESATAGRYLTLAHRAFLVCSLSAILATSGELLDTWRCLPVSWGFVGHYCGTLAVIFPVLAVAFLSLASAFDLEARHHTFGEMRDFLTEQVHRLEGARSEREFAKLLLESEARLLGETLNWFSRRSFSGVA